MRHLLWLALASACRAAAPSLEMPPPAAPVSVEVATDTANAGVRFMRGMIPHHAQALEMSALVQSRASREAIRLLGERIERSQRDEIAAMERWLRARNLRIPEVAHQGHHATHGGHEQAHAEHHPAMPGMLSHDQMMALRAARGPAFDRLFLELMIQHHEGALVMVRDLFAAPGAHDAELFRLASDIDADQRAEIARMQSLLRTLP